MICAPWGALGARKTCQTNSQNNLCAPRGAPGARKLGTPRGTFDALARCVCRVRSLCQLISRIVIDDLLCPGARKRNCPNVSFPLRSALRIHFRVVFLKCFFDFGRQPPQTPPSFLSPRSAAYRYMDCVCKERTFRLLCMGLLQQVQRLLVARWHVDQSTTR